jgi:hypothetical protein
MSDMDVILGRAKMNDKFFTIEDDGENGYFVRIHDTKYHGVEYHFNEDKELVEHWDFTM